MNKSGAAWVDSNLPSMDDILMPEKGEPSHTSGITPSEVSGAEMSGDARLTKDPSLPIHPEI